MTTGSLGSITLDELKEAGSKVFADELKVVMSAAGSVEKSAALRKGHGESVVLAYGILYHDHRAKLTFTRTNNAFDDVILISKDFDKDRALSAAIRIVIGNDFHRFRSKARVETLVKRVGASEILKALPQTFSDFMLAVLHVHTRSLGKDPAEAVLELRSVIRELLPHLSEEDVVRIYMEEAVDWVGKL